MASGSRTKGRAVRAERSRQTRQRILAAAAELFVRDGYLQTTMAGIAAQAGVAVQTLYLAFGSKVAMLSAALDVAIAGDDEPVPVLDRPWFARLRAEPDAAAALAVFVGTASRIIDRVYPLYAATRDASADPEMAEVLARNKQQRHVTQGRVVEALAKKAGFNPDLPVRRATGIVYTLMSQETYGLLVAERGWSVADWSAWVADHLRAELLAQPPA